MKSLRLEFRSVREERPGRAWEELFRKGWPSYRSWFISEGAGSRPDLRTCRRQLRAYMPELVPLWERLVELADGDRQAARMLSLYRPAPYLFGCSQAVWPGTPAVLVRNYDYHPRSCEGTLLLTGWMGVRVLGMSDCLWGLLDGINEHGLCLALSFGGRRVLGDGFGIPLVLRYVLQICRTKQEAIEVLRSIPVHMAYNVSVLDACGEHAVACLSPDRKPIIRPVRVATNHQYRSEWTEYDRLTRSAERERCLEKLVDAGLEADVFTRSFLEPPLYNRNFAGGVGTLYTATYQPSGLRVRLLWPDFEWAFSMDRFRERAQLVEYPGWISREGAGQ